MNKIATSVIAIPAPADLRAFCIWESASGGFELEAESHRVLAILLETERTILDAVVRRYPPTNDRKWERFSLEPSVDLHHPTTGDSFEWAVVGFLLAPDHCARWDTIIVKHNRVAFTREAAEECVRLMNEDASKRSVPK